MFYFVCCLLVEKNSTGTVIKNLAKFTTTQAVTVIILPNSARSLEFLS